MARVLIAIPLLLWPLAGVASGAVDGVVVAWDDAASGAGRLVAIAPTPPFAAASATLAVGADGRVRAGHGRVLHLSRDTGELTLIDAASFSVERTVALGAATAPRDVALADRDHAYVSSAAGSWLRRVDLATGAVTDAVDLAPLGVGDGSPLMETLLVHEGRLYVQLAAPAVFPPEPSFVAVVDLATETIVDVDPLEAGTQAILLEGTAPRFKMQVQPGADRLLVSSTGAFHDFGGLELIDLDAFVSLGVQVREWDDIGGNDLGAFVMTGPEAGWLVFSTDIVLSSHLHPFTLSGGATALEADTSLFYFAPHVVHDAARDTLFWPEPGGVQAFDGTTGAALAPATPVSGDPTDLALLSSPAAIPLPAWSLALAALLVAAGARSADRSEMRRGARAQRTPAARATNEKTSASVRAFGFGGSHTSASEIPANTPPRSIDTSSRGSIGDQGGSGAY